MTLDPRTSPLAYLARCAALRHRGLSADLTHDLMDANNEGLLVELEQADDEFLAALTALDEQRRAAAVTVFRYFPPEDHCEHPTAQAGRLVVRSSQVVGHANVLWCPACEHVVGPAPVVPLLWDGDQA